MSVFLEDRKDEWPRGRRQAIQIMEYIFGKSPDPNDQAATAIMAAQVHELLATFDIDKQFAIVIPITAESTKTEAKMALFLQSALQTAVNWSAFEAVISVDRNGTLFLGLINAFSELQLPKENYGTPRCKWNSSATGAVCFAPHLRSMKIPKEKTTNSFAAYILTHTRHRLQTLSADSLAEYANGLLQVKAANEETGNILKDFVKSLEAHLYNRLEGEGIEVPGAVYRLMAQLDKQDAMVDFLKSKISFIEEQREAFCLLDKSHASAILNYHLEGNRVGAVIEFLWAKYGNNNVDSEKTLETEAVIATIADKHDKLDKAYAMTVVKFWDLVGWDNFKPNPVHRAVDLARAWKIIHGCPLTKFDNDQYVVEGSDSANERVPEALWRAVSAERKKGCTTVLHPNNDACIICKSLSEWDTETSKKITIENVSRVDYMVGHLDWLILDYGWRIPASIKTKWSQISKGPVYLEAILNARYIV